MVIQNHLKQALHGFLSIDLAQDQKEGTLLRLAEFKDAILELVSKFEREQRDLVLLEMFDSQGEQILKLSRALLKQGSEDYLNLVSWILGLLCYSD